MPSLDDVRHAVQTHWGYDAFRPLQEQAIESVLAGRDSVVVLPTGGGKSLCFQAPAVCMPGVAVVLSPLIALMKDQIDALREIGVDAAAFNSTLSWDEKKIVVDQMRDGELKLLYLAPETLLAGEMLSVLASVDVSLFAIDEAHCVSSWGHDFRPEYRGLRVLKERFPNVGVHAYTATATERVRADIAEQLELSDPQLLVGSFDRPNLEYRVERRNGGLRQVIEVINRHPDESGIVYCITRKEVEKTAAALKADGRRVAPYHAGLEPAQRQRAQDAFLAERIDTIVATVAFGMGIDKSNVRYVVHTGMPKSLEAYQQESGRAGRDGLEAECCLFYSPADVMKWKRLIQPTETGYDEALAALAGIERFCSTLRCRHQLLAEHFGQSLDQDNCGACDYCLGELDEVDDPLTLSQKILSCVVRLDQRYGGDYNALVLTGSREKRILENGHDELSTYGLLGEHPRQAVRDWLEQLVGQGCAEKYGEYNLVALTDLGRDVLRGDHTPRLLKPSPKAERRSSSSRKPSAEADWAGVDRDLFEALRALRKEIASEKGVPAYIVFGDATLRDLARRRPSTEETFLAAQGVGRKKWRDYGERFLGAITAHCQQMGLAVDVEPID
ncbi:MAG: DNA helicase RecQ [Planctomycetota bacterium]